MEPTNPNPTQPEFKVMSPQATDQSPKKSWLKGHMILGIVFVVAVLAAIVAGIYYWQTVRQIPATVQVPAHKPIVDPTANWKIYTNDFYQFKYPLKYSITSENVVTDHKLVNGKDTFEFAAVNLASPSAVLSITKFPAGSDFTFSFQNAQGDFNNRKSSPEDSFTHVNIAGVDAAQVYIGDSATHQGQDIKISFARSGSAYTLEFLGKSKTDATEFNQILSTFKFTK